MSLEFLTTIINYLVGGIEAMAEGIGKGVNNLITNLMFVTETSGGTSTTHLSNFILVVAGFAGISLAVSIGRKIYNWIITLGGRK